MLNMVPMVLRVVGLGFLLRPRWRALDLPNSELTGQAITATLGSEGEACRRNSNFGEEVLLQRLLPAAPITYSLAVFTPELEGITC